VRTAWLIAVAACGGSEIDAPDDCAGDELHVVHGTIDERFAVANYAFVNKLSESSTGSLDIGMAGMTVHVEFDVLASNGSTVDARGFATLPQVDVGNCDANGFPGLLYVDGGYWRFELRDLAMPAYCGGPAVPESLRGCYRSE
jgi:hypothetical protein